MKKSILLLAIIILSSFNSCKNKSKNKQSIDSTEEMDIMENDVNNPEVACFRYTSAKDTVVMQLEKINEDVAGTLSYNYFEKDKNDGTLQGTMIGDTLFADYTFDSEGTTSVREIMFLKKGDNLIEGYADSEEVNGKFQFKKNAKFTFNETMPLKQVNCY